VGFEDAGCARATEECGSCVDDWSCGERGEEGEGEMSIEGGRGRGRKRREKGLRNEGMLERRGGLRTLRYMLKERRALFACGTYLGWQR
jgi:hypothetical protein